MKREVRAVIDITPGELAEMFLRMDDDDKARFFNASGFLLSMDVAYDIYNLHPANISKNSQLDSYGQWALSFFKQGGNHG